MINLGTVFWLMIGFFALVGSLRGWTREVLTTAGLILSLFALNQFGYFVANLLGPSDAALALGDEAVRRQQFYLLSAIHLTITFFSYQGPALAGKALSERLRIRDSLQDKVLGVVMGAVNGYLVVGTVWTFLEYTVGPDNWVQLNPGVQYPFATEVLARPGIETGLETIVASLPLPLLAPYLPFLVVAVFLFVIVVMI